MEGDRHDYSSDRNESDSTPVEMRIPCGAVTLKGALAIPPRANGVVVFATRLAADWFRRHFHTHSEATD